MGGGGGQVRPLGIGEGVGLVYVLMLTQLGWCSGGTDLLFGRGARTFSCLGVSRAFSCFGVSAFSCLGVSALGTELSLSFIVGSAPGSTRCCDTSLSTCTRSARPRREEWRQVGCRSTVCAAGECCGWFGEPGGAGRTASEQEAAAADLDDVVVVELPPLVLLERLVVQDGAAGVSLAHVSDPDLRGRDGGVAGAGTGLCVGRWWVWVGGSLALSSLSDSILA